MRKDIYFTYVFLFYFMNILNWLVLAFFWKSFKIFCVFFCAKKVSRVEVRTLVDTSVEWISSTPPIKCESTLSNRRWMKFTTLSTSDQSDSYDNLVIEMYFCTYFRSFWYFSHGDDPLDIQKCNSKSIFIGQALLYVLRAQRGF